MHRCAAPNGETIYTDRPCDSIGAAERIRRGVAPGNTGSGRGGCARTLQALIHEITYAIDSHDVNRLGAVYHWVGLDATGGDRVLDRLQAIVDRPLIDIVPLRTGATPADVESGSATADPVARETPPAAVGVDTAPTDASAPRPPARRAPIGLRVEQTLKNGSTPSRTVFGLRRHFDCWWIAF